MNIFIKTVSLGLLCMSMSQDVVMSMHSDISIDDAMDIQTTMEVDNAKIETIEKNKKDFKTTINHDSRRSVRRDNLNFLSRYKRSTIIWEKRIKGFKKLYIKWLLEGEGIRERAAADLSMHDCGGEPISNYN